ncbi:DUF192 domain-containing protein [Vreelandella jeotgali]|uniref:DUF192 domain-containing protein n=1 Tax=Vreelandella jeotgali TaxID=553386 RepID=UPI00034CBBBD|nr:DUF192 domain-containing protein [Halomonas jeotgali]
MMLTRRRMLAAALTLPAAALMPAGLLQAQPSEAAERHTAVIHTDQGPHRLRVEVAHTPAGRAHGLMGRQHLGAERGMLFVYDRRQPATSAFWMYRTLIPLDIAFIDRDGRIVSLQTMPPCESARSSECPAYAPGSGYYAALEVNAGYFADRGIREGDCISSRVLDGRCQ